MVKSDYVDLHLWLFRISRLERSHRSPFHLKYLILIRDNLTVRVGLRRFSVRNREQSTNRTPKQNLSSDEYHQLKRLPTNQKFSHSNQTLVNVRPKTRMRSNNIAVLVYGPYAMAHLTRAIKYPNQWLCERYSFLVHKFTNIQIKNIQYG